MSKQQSHLKNLLTNMIEGLNPEIEKGFEDYVESTSVKDKSLHLFESNMNFLELIVDTVDLPDGVDRVLSDSEFRKRIMNNPAELLFYQFAIVHDFKKHVQDNQRV